jgi:hypothetical protein
MDANTLVLSALRTGAIANTRFSAITTRRSKEAYQGLKSLLLNKFTGQGRSQAAQLIHDWDTNYPKFEAQMKRELEDIDIGSDDKVLDTANRLLTQLQPQLDLQNGFTTTSGGSIGGKTVSEYVSIIVPWSSDSGG